MTATANDVLHDVPTELIIGGEHRAASDGATFAVIDPATGDALTTVASGTVEDAIACVDAASSAAAEWASTPPRKRSEILQRTYQLMIDRADELARIRARTEELLARHTGRPVDRVRADLERDLFLDAEAAVEYGLADRIVPHRRAARTATGAR